MQSPINGILAVLANLNGSRDAILAQTIIRVIRNTLTLIIGKIADVLRRIKHPEQIVDVIKNTINIAAN
jgi:hypothetical protein